MSPDDARDLARAIGIAAKQADTVALEHVTTLFEYAPQLGHRLGTYMVVMAAAGTDIGPVWDALVAKSDVLNAWQRIWLVYIARATKLVTTPARLTWVDSQRDDDDAFLRAEATLAVAPQGLISFDEVDRAVRVEPEALIPWYALSAKSIPKVNAGRLQALMESHGVIEAILFRPQKINKKTP